MIIQHVSERHKPLRETNRFPDFPPFDALNPQADGDATHLVRTCLKHAS